MIGKDEREYYKSITPHTQIRQITKKLNDNEVEPPLKADAYSMAMVRRVFSGSTKTNEVVEKAIWDHYEELRKFKAAKKAAIDRMKDKLNRSSEKPESI